MSEQKIESGPSLLVRGVVATFEVALLVQEAEAGGQSVSDAEAEIAKKVERAILLEGFGIQGRAVSVFRDGEASGRPPYPSVDVLLAAGRAAFDWVVDDLNCHFCNLRARADGKLCHDDDCPFEGTEVPA